MMMTAGIGNGHSLQEARLLFLGTLVLEDAWYIHSTCKFDPSVWQK